MNWSNDQIEKELLELAKKASEKAYAPYSHFPVGCAILTTSGEKFMGCNVENISLGLTMCAERNAIAAAVGQLGPTMKVEKLVIYTPTEVPITPCGACRQVIREFGEHTRIFSVCKQNITARFTIDELLPGSPEIKL